MSHHDDIASLSTDIHTSFDSGDMPIWEDQLADDAIWVGTGDAEWMQGKDAILLVMRTQMTEMSAAGISVTGGEAITVEHGSRGGYATVSPGFTAPVS